MVKRKIGGTAGAAAKKPKTVGGHWSLGLLASLDDPSLFVKSDDLVTVIKDKYPKAEFHFLVVPKEDIASLKSVTSSHSDLLKHMEEVGLELANEEKYEGKTFKLGYHAEASMTRLHLHVISDDMNSACVKTKKHWNSFTSDFFMKSEEVRNGLKENGKVVLPSKEDCKEYMDLPLKCHKCDVIPKNMPELKRHILTHSK